MGCGLVFVWPSQWAYLGHDRGARGYLLRTYHTNNNQFSGAKYHNFFWENGKQNWNIKDRNIVIMGQVIANNSELNMARRKLSPSVHFACYSDIYCYMVLVHLRYKIELTVSNGSWETRHEILKNRTSWVKTWFFGICLTSLTFGVNFPDRMCS